MPAKQILAEEQKRRLHRLQRAGQIDAPKTAFAQKLLQDPLLMSVRNDKKDRPMGGPCISRLRRRVEDETHGALPYGDEEPGFPGLSMKRQQVRYTRELEEYAKQMAALGPETEPKAGLAPPNPQQPANPQHPPNEQQPPHGADIHIQ